MFTVLQARAGSAAGTHCGGEFGPPSLAETTDHPLSGSAGCVTDHWGKEAPRTSLAAQSIATVPSKTFTLAKAAISPARSPNFSDWLYRSSAASLIWLVVRLWLGYQWANAGYQKIWGSEKSAFMTSFNSPGIPL